MNKSSSPTVFTGDSLILHCSALGYPQPVVRWYKDSNFVHENTSLLFSSLNQSDSGFYTCNASSIAGSDAYKVQVLVRGRDEHVPLRISGNVFSACQRRTEMPFFSSFTKNDFFLLKSPRKNQYILVSTDTFRLSTPDFLFQRR